MMTRLPFARPPLARSGGRQQGASLLGVLIFVAVLAVLATAGLRLVPLYLDDRVVVNAVEGVLARQDADALTIGEIRSETRKTLTLNNIRDFDTDTIRLQREGGVDYVTVDYERRVPLFYNIDAVVTFDHRIDK